MTGTATLGGGPAGPTIFDQPARLLRQGLVTGAEMASLERAVHTYLGL
jgi:hypothetical protein